MTIITKLKTEISTRTGMNDQTVQNLMELVGLAALYIALFKDDIDG